MYFSHVSLALMLKCDIRAPFRGEAYDQSMGCRGNRKSCSVEVVNDGLRVLRLSRLHPNAWGKSVAPRFPIVSLQKFSVPPDY